MRLHTMWGARKGESMPELMAAWDEFSVDQYPEGFDEDCKRAKESWGSDLQGVRYINIEVSEEAVRQTFEPAEVEGRVNA